MPKLLIILFSLSLSLAPGAVPAMGTGDERNSFYDDMERLIEAGKYEKAIEALNEALTEDPEDAEVLNLIAYSHRLLKRYEIALNYYLKALEIEPDHRGANEYLGELYLHLGQLDKALERRDVLDDDCFFRCKELKALEEAIEEYRKQNPA